MPLAHPLTQVPRSPVRPPQGPPPRPRPLSTPHPGPASGAPGTTARPPELPRELRERLPARDAGALSTFFDHYFERVHGYVRRLVGEEHLAEDLVQEVFLHVHRSLPSYDPARPLSPWVFTIAANKVRDHWRSRRSQEERRAVALDADDGPDPVDEGAGPADGIMDAETDRAVAAAVAALPPMLRETFVLRYYEGLSFEEIGRIADRNETAVRKRYSRALGELRDALAHLMG